MTGARRASEEGAMSDKPWKRACEAAQAGLPQALHGEWPACGCDRIKRACEEYAAPLAEALEAVQTMRDTVQPRKLDEALTWRENDERAQELARAALARYRAEGGDRG